MCGILGEFVYNNHSLIDRSRFLSLLELSRNRGPDSQGYFTNDNNFQFGFNRLSILDLSENGNQQIQSPSRRYTMVFNGEIYNHLQLRKDVGLSGYSASWKGHSDTETLLAAFSTWGIKKALQATVGMFGLALLDLKERKLILARDRIGEKPVYYGWQNDTFLFGSELKALKAHPVFQNTINRDSLCLLLRHNTISSPHSIYEGIFKLAPGSILSLDLDIILTQAPLFFRGNIAVLIACFFLHYISQHTKKSSNFNIWSSCEIFQHLLSLFFG